MKSSNSTSAPPLDPNKGIYGFTNVTRTISGHQTVVDDTLGAETLSWKHCAGTSETWGPRGNRTLHVQGDSYVAILGESDLVVSGKCNITVLGDCDLKVEKTLRAQAKNIEMTASGNIVMKAGGAVNVESGGDYAVNAGGGYRLVVQDTASQKFKSDLITSIQGNNDLTIGKSSTSQINGSALQLCLGDAGFISARSTKISSVLSTQLASVGSLQFTSIGVTTFNSSAWVIQSGQAFVIPGLNVFGPQTNASTITAGGVIHSMTDVMSRVSLNMHQHIQGPGDDNGAGGITVGSF